jgi:hypothetical protein
MRHYTASDFVVVTTSPAYDGSAAVNRYGYCRKCKCDMQQFGGAEGLGPLRHYKSHTYARRVGAWGERN